MPGTGILFRGVELPRVAFLLTVVHDPVGMGHAREVYTHLVRLAMEDGDVAAAEQFLRQMWIALGAEWAMKDGR